MAQQFKVIVNTGKEQNAQTLQTEQGAGQRGRPLIIKAKAGAKYQLVESDKRDDLAPDNIKAKRVGKHLHLMFESDTVADVIIEDYYDVMPEGYNGVIGKAENGSFYEYVTEDPTDPGLIPLLADNATAVTQALGGAEVAPAGAALAFAAFPLLGALGLVGGAAAVAAAANTSATSTTTSSGTTTGKLDAAAPNDSGVLGDNKTNDNTPTLTGTVPTGSTATITINGVTYPVTINANGTWSFTNPTNLADGTYTPVLNVTTNGVTTPTNLTPFTIDTVTRVDIGNAGQIGTSNPISGTAEPGDTVVLKDANGLLIGSTVTDSSGNWSLTPTVQLPAGSIAATATDAAGNTATNTGTPANVNSLKTALTIDPISGDNVITAAEAGATTYAVTGKVTGTFAAGDVVTLTLNTHAYLALVKADGTYSVLVPMSDLKVDSDTKIEGSVTGAGGDTATAAQDYTLESSNVLTQTALSIDPVTADNIIGSTESTGNIAITGKVGGKFSAGDIVQLTIKGNIYAGAAAADGSYTISVPASDLMADSDTVIDGTVIGTGGSIANAMQNYGVDPNINPVTAPAASNDVATATEAGGVPNGTAVLNPTGNVVTNDTSFTGVKLVQNATGAAGLTGVAASGTTNITGAYGTLVLAADGTYTYNVANSNPTVEALRTTSDKLTDTFAYTLTDGQGRTSTAQLIVTVQGANDAPGVVGSSAPILGATNMVPTNFGTAFTFSDVDVGTGVMNLTLSSSDTDGKINVTPGTSGATISSGNGTNSVVVSGTLAQLQALTSTTSNFTFVNTASYNASHDVTITALLGDNGNQGNVAAPLTGSGAITFAVAADPNAQALIDITAITADSGVSATDYITNDNTLTYSGVVTGFTNNGDKVKVELLSADGATVMASALIDVVMTTGSNGTWTWPYNTAQPDGAYTLRATLVNTVGTRVNTAVGGQDTQVIMVDTGGSTNVDPTDPLNPLKPDPNNASNVTIAIGSIDDGSSTSTSATGSKDTGEFKNDFITSDGSLKFSGTTANFSAAQGDKVHLQVLDANNVVVVDQYVTPDSAGNWSFDNQGNTLPDGAYTIKAGIEDKPGNPVKVAANVPLIIDSSTANNQPGAAVDPNNASTVSVLITGIDDGLSSTTASTGSKDTGVSGSDYITADNKLTFFGTTTGFTANGDKVHVQILDGTNKVVAEQYVTPDAQGQWKFDNQSNAALPDGAYTIKADIVDKPGNVLQTDSHALYIKANPDTTNATATVTVAAISTDTGTSTSDFVTSDNTLTYSGTVTGFTNNGDLVLVELLDKTGSTVIAAAYVPATVTGTGPQSGTWTWTPTGAQTDGEYKIRATVVDVLGTRLNTTATGQDTKDLAIDTSASTNQPGGSTDPNSASNVSVAIGSIDDGSSTSTVANGSKDTGSDKTDNITSDGTLTFSGTTANFNGAQGAMVHVQVFNASNVAVVDQYVTPDATTGKWTFNNQGNTLPDGAYTIKAAIEDKAGNPVKVATSVPLVIDSSGSTSQPDGGTDPNSNTNVTIAIGSIDDGSSTSTVATGSKDTGELKNDFITRDGTLTFGGTTANFSGTQGDKVHVQVFNAQGVAVVDQYVMPNATTGTWTFNNQGNTLPDGAYTIKAAIEDKAGNPVKVATNVPLIIDSGSGTNVDPTDPVNPVKPDANASATVDITGMTTDSGVSGSDYITNDNTLTYNGTVAGFTNNGDKVKLELLAADGVTVVATKYVVPTLSGTAPSAGTWSWAYETTQADGQYTVRATIVDAADNRVNSAVGGQDTQVVIVDSSASTNQPGGSTDPNNASTVTIAIGGIDDGDSTTSKATGSKDTGEFANDNITSDGTLTFSGTTANFNGTQGAMVHVQVFNAQGVAVVDQYVTPDANGDWTFDNQGNTLPDGAYTIKAAIEDKAGNPVKVAAEVPLIVDGSSTTNQPGGSTDPNSGSAATISVTRIDDGDTSTDAITGSKDTGELANDFITSDSDLSFYGTTTGFNAANGAKVHVQILDANNALVAEQYVLPDAQGQWKFDNQTAANLADGNYTIQADIVDKAGNPVQTSSHALVIQTTVDPADPNKVATVAVTAITDDTGVSTSDFITGDNKLTYSGTVAGFTNNGDKVKLELLAADGLTVVATKYVVPTLSGTAPSVGSWSWAYETTQADGEYTIRATIVDKADLRVNTAAGGQNEQMVIVDTDGGKNQPDGSTNPNTTSTIDIVAITDDSGVSGSDFITNDKSLTYSGTVSNFTANGDKVKVELLAADGTTVLETAYVDVTGASSTAAGAGTWSWTRTTDHTDGQYTLRATIVDTSGNRTNATASSNGTGGGQDTQVVVIDTSGGTLQPSGQPDPNATATIDIVAITDDSGVSGSDFITNDKSLTYSGTVSNFTANGDKVKVELLAADGTTVIETAYVDVTGASSTTAGAGTWSWTRSADHNDGQYTLRATIVDTSGNRANATAPSNGTGGGQDTQVVVIDTSGGTLQPSGQPDPNATATIDIVAITDDSGVSGTDFITNDKSLTYSGTVSNFTANGDKVKVELLAADGTTVLETAYVDVTGASSTTAGAGTWSWTRTTDHNDGQYTLRATIVDTSGNRTNATAPTNGTGGGQDTQVVVIDTSGGTLQPSGQPDTNASATVDITSMTTDSGSDATDFTTNDTTLTYNGTVAGFTANGDKVKVELLAADGITVIATAYVDVTATTGSNGTWTWPYETTQLQGNYSVRATLVDAAGNRVNTAASGQDLQAIVIDTSGPAPVVSPEDPLNPPAGKTSLSVDSVTADNTLNTTEASGSVTITGTARGDFTAGDVVTLTIKGTAYSGTVNASGVYSIPVSGSDLAADSDITIDATLVAHDKSGNPGSITATKVYALEAAVTTTVTIDAISLDTGTSSTDFLTKDNDGLTVTGTLSTGLTTGQKLWYSKDNGATWTDITADVTGTAVSHIDAALTSTNTVQMRVESAGGNYGTAASQLVTIDATAPGFNSLATADVDENVAALTTVYTALATDAQTVSYSLKAGAGDAASFSIDPVTGEVKLTGSPDCETKASYSFTVVATDAAGNTSEQVVTLAVNNVDEVPPSFTSGATADAADENIAAGTVIYTAAATDTDFNDPATATSVTYSLKPATGDAASFTIDADTGEVTLTGSPDFETKPSYSFTVVATDAVGNTSEKVVTLAINNVNEAPANTVPGAQTATEDVNKVISGLSISDVDAGSSNVTVTLAVTHGTLTIDPASSGVTVANNNSASVTLTGTVTQINALLAGSAGVSYVPTANFNGQSILTMTTDDGGNTGLGNALSDQDTVTLNVTALNDAPTGANATLTALEDGSKTFAAADFGFADASDTPANALSAVIITTLPTAGTLKLNGTDVTLGQSIALADLGSLVYAPAANANGAGYATIGFKVQDDGGTVGGGADTSTSENTLTIDVTPVNDAPTGANATITVLEDGSKNFAATDFGLADASDTPANALSAVTITTLPTSGTLKLNGTDVTVGQSIAAADLGSLVYAPAANANGAGYATIGFKVQDDGGASNGGADTSTTANTLTINVTAVNDQPGTVALSFTGLEDNGGVNLAIAPVPTGTMGALVSSLADILASGNDLDNTNLGVAITSGLSTSANGKLWYSTDNGSTWTDLSTLSLSDTNALVLSSSARLYFQGNANVFGNSLATANMRLWDGTDSTASGSFADVTAASGASGAYAAANSTLSFNLTAINDEPALSATGTGLRTNAASNLTVFSNASADLGNSAESTQKFGSLTLTVSGLFDDNSEVLTIDGIAVELVTGSTTTTNGWTAAVTLSHGTATVTLTHTSGASVSDLNTLVDGIRYSNATNSPTDGDRVITLTSLQDNGGTANSGDDTVALNIVSTITLDTTASTTLATIDAINDDVGLIKGVIANNGKTDDTSLNLNGTLNNVLAAGETLRIYDGSTLLGTATVTTTGATSTWTFIDSRTLTDTQKVAYKAVVFDGLNEGVVSNTYTATVDLTPPVITITSVVGDTLTLSGTDSTGNGTYDALERGTDATTATTLPVISGNTDAEAGQTVVVTLNGKNYTATVQSGGTWSVELPNADAVALNHGNTLPIIAAVTDKAGLSATDTNNQLVVNIASPDIPTVDNKFSSTVTPTLTGQAQKALPTDPVTYMALQTGDTLTVTVGGATYTGTLDASAANNGLPTGLSYNTATKQWSLDTSTATPTSGALTLVNGNTYDVDITVNAASVTEVDISTDELSINTTPPVITIDVISGDSLIDASEKNTPLIITGTTDAEVGCTVTITGLDGTPRYATVIAGTGPNSGTNVFSVTVPASSVSALADNTYTVSANVVNVYGLNGTDTEPVKVDFVASTTTVAITAINDDVGTITGVVANDGRTDDTQPGVSGTLSTALVTGEVVQVYDGSTLLGTATVTDTTWTFADPRALTDAQKVTYTALVFDGANKGTVSNAYSATVDLTPPTVVNDIQTAQEKGGASNATAGIDPSGDVLTNDTAGANDSLSVKDVKGAGTSATTVAASGTTNIVGSYGTLTIAANGSYSYAVDQTNATVQALKASSTGLSEVFTYTAKDVAGLTATATLTITVNGADDNATISGTISGAVTEDAAPNTASGTLTVADVDAGQAVFQTPASLSGTYGTFTFDAATGVWGYTLDNTKTSVQALAASQQVTDTLTVKSSDGTATQDVKVTITGANDVAVITGTATGAVTEDASTNAASGAVTVTDVDTGQAVFQTPTSLAGTYGSYTFDAATGAWGYTLDNSKLATQALAANQQVTDTLTVKSSDGSATQDIVVTVTGINDPATFSGDISKAITESNVAQTATGTLTVADVDSATTVTAQTNVVGSAGLGKFSIDSAGAWSYVMDSAQNQLKPSDVITDSLTVSTADGTQKVISVTITGTNDAPVLTTSAVLTYTEAQAATAINTLISAADADNSTQTSAQVAITSGFASAEDVLSFMGDSATMGNITGSYSAGVMSLVSAGSTATLAQWQAALQAVKYSNTSSSPNTATRTVSYTLNDGAVDSAVLTSTINVVSVNNAPVNTVPAAQTTLEDTAKVITGLSIADADAGTGSMTVTLSVAHGTVNVVTGTGVTLTTNGTSSVQLTGTVADINTLLASTSAVTYTPTTNYNGSDALTLLTSDNGNTGGTALTDSDDVAITVTAVNDAPVNTVPGAQTTAEDTAKVISGLSIADVDAGTGTVTVTLSVAHGTISVAAGTGVTPTTNGTASVTLNGTVADINTLLATASAVSYTPTLDYNGSDTLTVLTNDGGNTGGTALSDTDTVTITVTPVNDAPVIVTSANALTTLEDTATTFVISSQLAGKVSDADGTALKGIVIVQSLFTAANPTVATGTWAYSTDGTTWVNFPTTYLGTVDWTKVMYLNASDSLRFTPFANTNGASLADLNFRAVDATFPNTTSGTQVNISTTIGGTGAVSNQPGHFTVSVTPVNDPPVFASDVSRTTLEDTTFEEQVSSLLAGKVTDIDSAGIAGVGITWDFGSGHSSTGTWYWADSNKSSWTAISKPAYGPSTSIFLKATDYLRFVPAANADTSAQQGNLVVRVADDSMPATTSGSILNLTGTLPNYWSAGEHSIIVNPTPVNDAPVINTSTAVTISAITEDAAAPSNGNTTAGMAVSDIFPVISDVDTSPSKGIAITSVNGNGTLYYTTDNGVTWQSASGLSISNALLLDANSRVYFKPNADWNGTIDNAFLYLAWDKTNAAAVGSKANISATGGSTAYSLEVGKVGITVNAVNDAPTGANATITVLEDGSKTFAASDFGFADVLDTPSNALSAVIITTLPIAGTLKLNGTAVTLNQSIAAADLGNLVFAPAANANGTAYATIGFKVQDNGGTANGGVDTSTTANTLTINVTAVNDAPVLTNTSTITYVENAAAAVINTAIVPSDVDNTTLATATVSITAGLEVGKDVLSFTNVLATMGNIALTSYNATTGVLTLTSPGSTATVAQWQAALRAVQFSSTTENSASATRTISYVVNDGTTDSAPITSTVNFTSVNDAPTGANATLTILEDGSKTFAASDFGFNDVDGNALSAVIITTLPTVGTLKLNGTAVTVNQSIPVASLGSLVYAPVANASGAAYATIGFKVKDDGGVLNSGADTSTTANTLTITVTPVNDAPVLATTSTITYVENAAAAVINSVIVPTDVDNTTFASAKVSITAGFEANKDVLSFTNASMGNIAGSYDATTGVMTLTSAGSTATLAQWQAALRAVKFNSTTDNPVSPRTVSYVLNDGTSDSNVINSTVNFTAANDAPINTVPTAQTGVVGIATAITGLSIADADANSGNMQVTLSFTAATVGVINVSGGTAAITGNGTNSVVLTGTLAAINATLAASVTYTLAANAPVTNTLTMLTTDNGNTGGTALTDSDPITITAQNIVITNTQVVSTSAPAPVLETFDTSVNGASVKSLSTVVFDVTTLGQTLQTGGGTSDIYWVAPAGYGTATGKLVLDNNASIGDTAGWFTFKLKPGNTMSGTLSMWLSGLQVDKTITFLDINGNQVGSPQTLLAPGAVEVTKTFTMPTGGNAITAFKISGPADTFYVDQISFTGQTTATTTINNALTTTTGTSTSVTPVTVNGTLNVALAANEVVEVFRNGVSIGNATVTGTTWKMVDSSLNTVQTDLYEARIKNTSTSTTVADSNDYLINPLTLAITSAGADVPLSDSFSTTAASPLVTSASTALWNVTATNNQFYWANDSAGASTAWVISGGSLEMGPTNSPGVTATYKFAIKGGATFSGISFLVSNGTVTHSPSLNETITFYNASNTLLGSSTFNWADIAQGQTKTVSASVTSQASYFTISGDGTNGFTLDNLAYTTTAGATSFTISSGGTMVDTTPVLNGTIPRALVAGETVDIFLDGATTPVGSATIAAGDTAWTWTQPTALTAATHTFVAKIKSGGAYIGSSNTFSVVVAATPLTLDLNGDGVQTVGVEQGVQFDLLATGAKQTVGWVDKHDGLLVMDLNGDGQVNSSAELFGDHTKLADGSLAQDGWAALAALDSNADGVIDAKDVQFDMLRVWVDSDTDANTDAGELRTLADMHIASINLNHDNTSLQQNGNVVQAFSSYTMTDGVTHEMADVGLKVQASDAGLFTLRNGDNLDLSALSKSTLVERIDMTSDTAANTVKLTLSDVLSLPATNGQHKLMLTGDANDTADVSLNEWLNTGNTVTDNGHSYTVYNGATDSSAQLLIDQHMLMANHG